MINSVKSSGPKLLSQGPDLDFLDLPMPKQEKKVFTLIRSLISLFFLPKL